MMSSHTTTLEALTENKSRLVILTDVMNELAIFGLVQILPQRVQFCSWLERATVYLRGHSGIAAWSEWQAL
jgi:hypothetical protein